MNKNEIINIISDEFRQYGYSALSLSQISKATGLGKASLYHHFPGGKEEMATQVLSMANKWIEVEILKPIQEKLSPNEKLKLVLKKLNKFYDSGKNYCLIDVMMTGNDVEKIQAEVKLILKNLYLIFETIFTQAHLDKGAAEKKANEALCLIQGALVLSRAQQNHKIFKQQLELIENHFL